jgi:hypothetical protein
MVIKAMLIIQLLLDIVLGFLVLWCLWMRGEVPLGRRQKGKGVKALQKDMGRWESTSRELLGRLKVQLNEMRAVAEELDRAEIRGSETLEKLQRIEEGWKSERERYDRASAWLRQGLSVDEVARRTGIGPDEIRMVSRLAGDREAR